ncbi:MAG: NTP transferase domain-containing protein [Phycisphaeraceae bacterium]
MNQSPSNKRALEAIIMAAGKGTRMNSDLPKVLHPVADRAMVQWVVDACEAAGSRRQIMIVGHGREQVEAELAGRDSCVFVEQREQLGTGHAVMQAGPLYKEDADDVDVLVLAGDGPLIRPSTLEQLLKRHRENDAAATIATATLEDATGYGRIVRDAAGGFERIVEEKDATDAEKNLREVNPSYYCFRAADLFAALDQTNNDNAKGEYYLTDVLGILIKQGRTVEVIEAVPAEDVLSINTPVQQAEVDAILRRRLAAGVRR